MSTQRTAKRPRAYGSGHFEKRKRKLKSGRVSTFFFGYVYSKHPKENGDKRHFGTGATAKEAETVAQAKADQHDADWALKKQPARRANQTFLEALSERHQHPDQPFTSFKKYRSVIKFATDFEPVKGGKKLGDYLVSDIEIHHLEPMFRSWCATHKGQSRHFMRDMLSGLFRRLVKRKVIDVNPAEDLPKFKRKAKKANLKTTDSDLAAMFEAADVRLKAMLLLSRRNLRIGEILGLTEACIDRMRVTVSRQANTIEHPNKGEGQASLWALTHLKHNGDERVMVLDESELQVVLASLALAKPVSIFNTITERWETHRFVIPNANGGDWHYNDFIRALKALTKKCNVQFTSHDGRRLFATNILAEDQVSPDAVRVSMGHSDINVTMLYAKSDRDSERVVNEVASRQVKTIFGLQPREAGSAQDVEIPSSDDRNST